MTASQRWQIESHEYQDKAHIELGLKRNKEPCLIK